MIGDAECPIRSSVKQNWRASFKRPPPAPLPAELQPKIPADVRGDGLNVTDFEFKMKLIERTLIETGGNVAKASRILKLSKS